jgi:hypothetical protein
VALQARILLVLQRVGLEQPIKVLMAERLPNIVAQAVVVLVLPPQPMSLQVERQVMEWLPQLQGLVLLEVVAVVVVVAQVAQAVVAMALILAEQAPQLLEQLILVEVEVEVQIQLLLVRLAALVSLFFPFQPLNTQAQPQVHQQLQPAVQTQF